MCFGSRCLKLKQMSIIGCFVVGQKLKHYQEMMDCILRMVSDHQI